MRDRLLAWVARPGRAKRLFAEDVERLGAERDARAHEGGDRSIRSPGSPFGPGRCTRSRVRGPTPAAPATAAATAPDEQATDDATGSAAVAARLKTHKGRIENQPEPVSAREQNRRNEAPSERAAAQAETAPPAARPAAEHGTGARAAHPARLAGPVGRGRAPRAAAARPRRGGRCPSCPAPLPLVRRARGSRACPGAGSRQPRHPPQSRPRRAADEQPSPAQKQPVPAWLDTYDDEADVTRDIDLSKTPPPMSASAVRDRTRTGDDIVPRH